MAVIANWKKPLTAAVLATLAVGATAQADISDVVFTIRAENANGVAEYQARFDDGYYDAGAGTYDWSLPQGISLMSSSGELIAGLSNARVFCRDDPQVDLHFTVFAGSLNTVFTITSPTLGFASIAQAEGRTSAGFTATDLDGDGVSLSSWNGGNIYTSRYNGAVPGGTVFNDHFNGTFGTPVPGDSYSISEEYPGGGTYVPIPGVVNDMSSRFRFTLSANDIAAGTSLYEILPVPAPSAMTLLGLGGILVARRRR